MMPQAMANFLMVTYGEPLLDIKSIKDFQQRLLGIIVLTIIVISTSLMIIALVRATMLLQYISSMAIIIWQANLILNHI